MSFPGNVPPDTATGREYLATLFAVGDFSKSRSHPVSAGESIHDADYQCFSAPFPVWRRLEPQTRLENIVSERWLWV
jgi:hypothetical protein